MEGCDNKILSEKIIAALAQYRNIISEQVKDVFNKEKDSEGSNVTGIYSVKMHLSGHIPQLIPLYRRRVKIYVWHIPTLNTYSKRQLLSASSLALKLCTNGNTSMISYSQLQILNQRAKSLMLNMLNKHASQLYWV